jgi:hypothetical protein
MRFSSTTCDVIHSMKLKTDTHEGCAPRGIRTMVSMLERSKTAGDLCLTVIVIVWFILQCSQLQSRRINQDS